MKPSQLSQEQVTPENSLNLSIFRVEFILLYFISVVTWIVAPVKQCTQGDLDQTLE